jgi:hypothetical protein
LIPFEFVGLDFTLDRAQARLNLLVLVLRKDTCRHQAGGMRQRAQDIVTEETPIQ